jgi:hypothetical protein
MTTKIIPADSSNGVYYGPSYANDTIVNHHTILSPTTNPGSRYGDNAVDLYEANNLTFLNTGTINSRYAATGGDPGAGILFTGKPGQHVSITNMAPGVIEDTGGFGFGIFMYGGTVVNYGAIRGDFGATYVGAGINMGANGGYISNASTGIITGGIYGQGVTNIVNAGTILEFTTSNEYGDVVLKTGGSITNLGTAVINAEGGIYGIKVGKAKGVVTNAGYINGGTGDAVTLTGGYYSTVVVDPGARFKGLVDGGSAAKSILELGSGATTGTLSGFGSEYVNFGTLTFAPSAQWLFETSAANKPGVIDGFTHGDTIDVTGFTATNTGVVAGGTSVTLTNSGGTHEVLNFGSSVGSFTIATGPGISGTDITTICFCPGTMIRTPNGEVKVEHLSVGDTVTTLGNNTQRITWIGHGKVLATRGKRGPATPVIVRKGALADNMPNRDLHVTKGHSLYFDGVLIPVEFLVNHKSILWDDKAREVEIYHVELATHDVLFANGAPAESYRDDGNRWLFRNANDGWDEPGKKHYAPVLTGGPVVDDTWHRLLDRAGGGSTMSTTEDPDLHLLVDGVRVNPHKVVGSKHVFRLPVRAESVRIVSRDTVPAELGLTRDPRSLGVALRQVVLSHGRHIAIISADDIRLTEGFHGYEPDDNLRWTTGDATLPVEAFATFRKNTVLELHLGCATIYPLFGESEEVAA